MSAHANFAVVLCLHQHVLQDLIRILYNDNQIIHELTFDALGMNLFLDPPKLSLSKNVPDCFIVDITAWGDITVPLNGAMLVPETRRVKFSARVDAPQNITLENGLLNFDVDWWQTTAEAGSVRFDQLDEDPFSPDAQQYLQRISMALEHTGVFGSLIFGTQFTPTLIPSFDINPIVGGFINLASSTATARCLDGVLAIGIDVSSASITTTGDPDQLVDITNNDSLACCINESIILSFLYNSTKPAVEEAFHNVGASLPRFNITINEGYFHISGKGKGKGGTVIFSMDCFPQCSAPPSGRYGRNELWFDLRNVTVDMNRSWWTIVQEVLGGLFTFGIAVIIVESIISSLRSLAYRTVASYDGFPRAPLNLEYRLPGVSTPTIRLTLQTFEVHRYGVVIVWSFEPQFRGGGLLVEPSIPIDTTRQGLRLRASLRYTAHPADPSLRISWTVRATKNNEIIFTASGPTQTYLSTTVPLPIVLPVILDNSSLVTECRIFRELGRYTTDISNDIVTSKIIDPLDRSHPFVKWGHYVLIANVRKEVDGSHTLYGGVLKRRRSCIHRTDFPGRCTMVSKYSIHPPRIFIKHVIGDRSKAGERFLTYLDRLPFSRSQMSRNRKVLCGYCFFGGPNNIVPFPMEDDLFS